MPLQDAIVRGGRDYPDRPALLFEGRTWSYRDLDATSDRIAANLIAAGLHRGDRVALLFANGPEIVFSYYACFKAGLIAVPLNTRMKGLELAYVLNHSGARVLLGQADLCRALEPVRADLLTFETSFIEGGESTPLDGQPFAALLREPRQLRELPAVNTDDIAVLVYTSGTTARPKGVTHSHGNLERLTASCIRIIGGETMAVNAVVPPLAHMGSLAGVMLPTYQMGGAMLALPGFDPVALLRAIQTYRVSSFWLLPVMYAALMQAPNAASYDMSSIRVCLSAGDSMPMQTRERFREMFGLEMVELCGMTELIYSCNRPGEANRPGSIGKALPGVRIRLVDDLGAEVPRGEVGEILAQGDAMMSGYWRDPQATAEAIRDGWLHTGDLAREDDDGYYWFAGRKKDIIIRGGSNIAPAEVEEALCTHPAVFMAGVVGVPDPIFGQSVWALVALKPDAVADAAALKKYVGERLADYKTPATIRIVSALPIGLTGKIHRQTLREWAAAGQISHSEP